MKRWIMVCTILASLLFIFVAAAAAGDGSEKEQSGIDRQYYNMDELFQHWEDSGYPDYVGGVFSSDGSMNRLTVLLVEDDGSGENQIRASLANTYGLSFGTSKYSYNQLSAVNDEIVANYLISGSKVYGVGVGWASAEEEVNGFGKNGKEFRVVVTVDESVLTEYKEKFDLLYGDMVEVQAGSESVTLSTPTEKN